jgi:hypothetical protein
MLDFWLDQVQPWPSYAALTLHLTPQHPSKPLHPSLLVTMTQNNTCPCSPCHHLVTSPSGRLSTAPPCPGRPSTSPGPALALPWSNRRMHTPAAACPDAPRDTQWLARTRTMASLDATERRHAPSPHASPRSPHAHVDSPRSPLPPGHRHWLARALSPSPWTTTIRHGHRNARTVTIATDPHSLRHQAPCTRADVAHTQSPLLAPSSPWNADVVDDLARSPQYPWPL